MTQMPDILRHRLRNLIGSDMRQLLSDYDVDPALLDHDPEYGDALNALIDSVVSSVRTFDAKTN